MPNQMQGQMVDQKSKLEASLKQVTSELSQAKAAGSGGASSGAVLSTTEYSKGTETGEKMLELLTA